MADKRENNWVSVAKRSAKAEPSKYAMGFREGALAPEIPAYTKAQLKRLVSKMKALMSQRVKLDKQIQNLENKDAEKRVPTRIFGSDI